MATSRKAQSINVCGYNIKASDYDYDEGITIEKSNNL